MSVRSSFTKPVLLLVLLLLIPAYDGVNRAYLPALYLPDIKAVITQLQEQLRELGIKLEQSADSDILDHQQNNIEPSKNIPDSNANTDNTDVRNDDNAAAIANHEFNTARSQCGLSTLATDTELQKIALGHANYIKYVFSQSQPRSFNAHYQNEIADIATVTGKNNPHYSGLDIKNRMFNADYANIKYGFSENVAQSMYYHSAGELLSVDTATVSMAKSLLAAPYHLRSIMLPSSKVIGSAVVAYTPYNKEARTNKGYVLVSNAAATASTVNTSYAGILTYPCQGVTGTVTGLYNETPDPVKHTGRNLSTDPIGQPVYIGAAEASSIKIINVSFYDTARRIEIPTQILDYRSDPYRNTEYQLPKNEAFILPITDDLDSCDSFISKNKNCGLHGNSSYQVSFDIIINDQRMIHQSFSFMTGAVNNS